MLKELLANKKKSIEKENAYMVKSLTSRNIIQHDNQ